MRRLRRSARLLLPVIGLLSLAAVTWLRLGLVDHLTDRGFFIKYFEFAGRILAGDLPRDRLGDLSPGYLWFVVFLRWLGSGVETIRSMQIVAVSVAALLAALAAKRLGGSIAGIASAILILGNAAALICATELEPETLILLLNASAVALLVEGRARNATGLLALAGLMAGLSAVTRPVTVLAVALVALWLLRHSRRASIAFVCAALAPIAIVLLVNRSLTGNTIIMQPGTVFYEANNPLSTGCGNVMPRIIADMNAASREPDFLHVAYRVVASKATGQPPEPGLSNRYWTARSFAFVQAFPAAAMRILGAKAIAAVHSYEVWDLVTMKRKADELSRYPSIRFGLIFALAIVGMMTAGRWREWGVVALFGVATLAALIAFNVTARQRNAVLPALAVLGGVGVASLAEMLRSRPRRAFLTTAGIAVAAAFSGIEGTPQREDAYNWSSAFDGSHYLSAAFAAQKANDPARATQLAARASIYRTAEPLSVPPEVMRSTAAALALRETDPRRRFDLAIALEKAGAWKEAESILIALENYTPRRENRAVSSVSYYRARAALHLRGPAAARPLLDQAAREAGGDPDVLALRALLGVGGASGILDQLHDPFTRDFALANAHLDVQRRAEAMLILESLRTRIPEWDRPARYYRKAAATPGLAKW